VLKNLQNNMSSTRTSPAAFLKHATEVASFYGFHPSREIERIAANRLVKRKGAHSFETVAAVCATCVALRPQEPALAFYATPQPAHLPHNLNSRDVGEFGLEVIGSNESVGEVVLLKTIAAILTEWDAPISRVRINALGDKDSQQRFQRELSTYLRKHQQNFSDICKERPLTSPLIYYSCTHESCRAILADGPRSVNFLSEKSRAHFRSVLEHLENLGLPYELDDLLVGDERDPHIAFAVDLAGEDATVVSARGGRFDEYLRRETGRKEAVGVAASIFFRKKGAARGSFNPPQLGSKKTPKVYFVQLGLRAKLQGLTVVDMLREARIGVMQSFDSTHLSPQLLAAREQGVSYMLIMGQREALDGTIIVRSTQNSSQTIVGVRELPRYLKTLRM
jgi:histidyl-tRNA synthetase